MREVHWRHNGDGRIRVWNRTDAEYGGFDVLTPEQFGRLIIELGDGNVLMRRVLGDEDHPWGQLGRWAVTPELASDGSWDFRSYRAWVVDADTPEGATRAYVLGLESSFAEIAARSPGVTSDPWDGEGRPAFLGVAPMAAWGFSTYLGPDRKHSAEVLDALFDWDAAVEQALPQDLRRTDQEEPGSTPDPGPPDTLAQRLDRLRRGRE